MLKKLVLIQSGSYDKTGIDQVVRLIADVLTESDIATSEIPQESYGDILIASSSAAGDRDNILLIGHMDTVFPEDTAFNWWRESELLPRSRIHAQGELNSTVSIINVVYC